MEDKWMAPSVSRLFETLKEPSTTSESLPPDPFGLAFAKSHLTVVNQLCRLIHVAEISACGLEQYLAVAEARYVQYLAMLVKKSGEAFVVPPWDVCLLSYAHHLDPFAFESDLRFRKALESIPNADLPFPAEVLASLIEDKVWSDPDSEAAWKENYPGSPYQVWPKLPKEGQISVTPLPSVSVTCPREDCLSQNVFDSERWTQLRTYGSSFPCVVCGRNFGKNQLCLANLLRDCKKFRGKELCDHDKFDAWTGTNYKRCTCTADSKDLNFRCLKGTYFDRAGELVLYEGGSPYPKMWSTLGSPRWETSFSESSVRAILDRLRFDYQGRIFQETFESLKTSMQAAYESSVWPNLSVDLLAIVHRIRPMMSKFISSGWFTDLARPVDSVRHRYNKYMFLQRKALQPHFATSDIIFCSWTHCLSSESFKWWCEFYIGRWINVLGSIDREWRISELRAMQCLWQESYHEAYLDPTELKNEILQQFGRKIETLDLETEVFGGRNLRPLHREATNESRARCVPSPSDHEHQAIPGSVWTPLRRQHCFRLLRFGRRTASGELSCHLFEYEIDEAPRYKAISYAWESPYLDEGDGSNAQILDPGCILCNGHKIPLSANGLAVLQQLYVHEVDTPLWMDAICINQLNTAEKSQQVGIMDLIYSNAAEVIAWLGPDHSYVDDLRWASTTFRKAIMAEWGYQWPRWPDALLYPKTWSRIGLPRSPERLRRAAMFSAICRWFNRSWIIQEVVLSRNIVMLCGSTYLSFTGLYWLGLAFRDDWNTMIQRVTSPNIPRWFTLAPSMCKRVWQAGMIRRGIDIKEPVGYFDGQVTVRAGVLLDLLECTSNFRDTDTTDPRDKVFAFLPLVQRSLRRGNRDITLSEWVVADYSANLKASHLYRSLIVQALECCQSLDPLGFVGPYRSGRVQDLPSWVPDFTAPKIFSTMFQYNGSRSGRQYDVWADNHLDLPSCEVHGEELEVYGIKLALVDDPPELKASIICRYLRGLADIQRPANLSHIETLMWTLLMRDPKNPVTGYTNDDVKTGFCNWILHILYSEFLQLNDNKHWNSQEGDIQCCKAGIMIKEEFDEVFNCFGIETLHKELPSWDDFTLYSRAMFMSAGSPEISRRDSDAARDYVARVSAKRHAFTKMAYDATKSRGLFRAKAGCDMVETELPDRQTRRHKHQFGSIGMGPETLVPGDEIWCLHGGRVPFILRRCQGNASRFNLVGECFMLGCMYGERLKKEISLLDKAEKIVLV